MSVQGNEIVLLDDRAVCSAHHLLELSGLTGDELMQLVEHDLIRPADPVAQPTVFHLQYVVVANQARRLRDDFELDVHGLVLALTLLRRIEQTEQELNATRAQLSRYRGPRA